MIPHRSLRFTIFYLFASLAFSSFGFAQGPAALSDTDLGKSQNTPRDLANSLVPGQPNLSKGEKKSEVDPKTLQSKKMKDSAFEGGLNDLDLDWRSDKMAKPRMTSNSEANSNTSAQKEHSTADEASTGAKQKSDVKAEKKSGSDSAHEKGTAATAEKTSEKEKSSATKSDGDR